MSSFLDELKQKLKSGNANAKLEIITGGNNPRAEKGIPWGKILGWVGGATCVIALVVVCILFFNAQQEKRMNLNVVPAPPAANLAELEEEEEGEGRPVSRAANRIEQHQQNVDPNFTLLVNLM